MDLLTSDIFVIPEKKSLIRSLFFILSVKDLCPLVETTNHLLMNFPEMIFSESYIFLSIRKSKWNLNVNAEYKAL